MRGGQQVCFAKEAVSGHQVCCQVLIKAPDIFGKRRILGLVKRILKGSEIVVCNLRKECMACANGSTCRAVIFGPYHPLPLYLPQYHLDLDQFQRPKQLSSTMWSWHELSKMDPFDDRSLLAH